MSSLMNELLAEKLLEENVEVLGKVFTVVGKDRSVVSQIFADSRNKKGVLNTQKAENKLLAICVLDHLRQPVGEEHEWGRVAPQIARPLIAVVTRVCALDADDLSSPKDSDSTQS